MRRRKKFWKDTAQVSEGIFTNLVMYTGALMGLIYLIRPSVRKHKKSDLKIFELLRPYENERNTRIMSAFTFFGTHSFFIPANITLIFYFLFSKRSWLSIRVLSIAISSLAMMFYLKAIFRRKRPEDALGLAKGLSFPSGHAIMSVTFYGLLIYIISNTVENKVIKISSITALIFLIQAIGFSRVYLRVHYASDVAVGYIAGLLWLLISLGVIKNIEEFDKLVTENLPGHK